MKISIENFKSIKSLQNFEIKPFTVLSGVNSSGKSSFIQLLLLLKQTIELDSSKQPFLLNGELYKVREFKDVITDKDLKRNLKVSFEFNKSEFIQIENLKTISVFNGLSDYKCLIEIKYDINPNNNIYISQFSVNFVFSEEKEIFILFKSNSNNIFSIETNSAIFEKELYFEKPIITNIHFSSIYPEYYETEQEEDGEMGDYIDVKKHKFYKELINIEDIKTIINSFFQNISYIEPIRNIPMDEYSFSRNHKNVGTKGEFVAQILEKNATEPIIFCRIDKQDNGIISYKEDSKY